MRQADVYYNAVAVAPALSRLDPFSTLAIVPRPWRRQIIGGWVYAALVNCVQRIAAPLVFGVQSISNSG